MCGIAGYVHLDGARHEETGVRYVSSVLQALAHRGPDSRGAWFDTAGEVALAHTRLAIIDLTVAGHQPMESADGRYVLVFNGEIYNFRELRRELEGLGHRIVGTGDTEVLLAAICQWGLRGALERANGMWAIGLWDKRDRTLSLARDRLGEKPLFYGWVGRTLVFGSELKALRAFPGFSRRLSRPALASYLRYMYVPTPHCIYENTYKLPPGTILEVRSNVTEPSQATTIARYWSAREAALRGLAKPFAGTEFDAAEELERLLSDAVRLRLEADVPLGAFLSGGVDSSMIVALMQRMHSKPVHTFTIGLRSLYSEAKDAHAVARHLGTEHTEIYVTPEQAMEVVPLLPSYYDEPFADYSQIPMMLISQLTRHHVTVCLSGDGGDELFAGYDRVVWGQRIWRRFGWMPASVRRGIAAGLGQIPAQPMDRIVHAAQRLMPRNRRIPDVTGKAQKLASFLPAESADAMYYDLVSVWKDPALLLGPVEEPQNPVTDPLECAGIHDATERMLHRDIIMSLPDDMLQKVDRASMSVGLEVRVPFLDHRLVEFSWTLPLAMKMRARRSKWILRQVLHKHVPRKLIERPKQGFGVPMVDWLRGPMRDWAESLLDESVLRSDGILDPKPVRSCWSAHLAGRRNDHQQIWIILMFQAWLDENRPLTS